MLIESTPLHAVSLSLTAAHRDELATFKASLTQDALALMQAMVRLTMPTMLGVAVGMMAPVRGDKIDFDLPRFEAELNRIVREATATDGYV